MTKSSDVVSIACRENFAALANERLAGRGGRIVTSPGHRLIFQAELTGETNVVHLFLVDGFSFTRRDESGRTVATAVTGADIKKIILFPQREVTI